MALGPGVMNDKLEHADEAERVIDMAIRLWHPDEMPHRVVIPSRRVGEIIRQRYANAGWAVKFVPGGLNEDDELEFSVPPERR